MKISYNWSVLNKEWFETEKNMHKYEYQPNLKKRFMITTMVVMFLALGTIVVRDNNGNIF